MRKKVIAGNWKMNMDMNDTVALISELKNEIRNKNLNASVIVCPPFTNLDTASALIKDSSIKLGAQNMYFEENGAFTGEISPSMLKSVGCEFVILGHSERRTIFGESDQVINKKIKTAVKHGLKPIFCIGETLEEREGGITFKVIEKQISNGLEGLSGTDLAELIVAYEPVWAIGTGKTATPDQAQEVHAFIRQRIAALFNKEVEKKTRILYGGSVKPDNIEALMAEPDIDGALVGGASLEVRSFKRLIQFNS